MKLLFEKLCNGSQLKLIQCVLFNQIVGALWLIRAMDAKKRWKSSKYWTRHRFIIHTNNNFHHLWHLTYPTSHNREKLIFFMASGILSNHFKLLIIISRFFYGIIWPFDRFECFFIKKWKTIIFFKKKKDLNIMIEQKKGWIGHCSLTEWTFCFMISEFDFWFLISNISNVFNAHLMLSFIPLFFTFFFVFISSVDHLAAFSIIWLCYPKPEKLTERMKKNETIVIRENSMNWM